MSKYNSVAVIYGSDSSEWEVSCRSGEFVASRIDGNEYNIFEIFARFGKWSLVAYKKRNSMRVTFPEGAQPEIDKNDFSVSVLGQKVKFDFAYIVQHGIPGENGQIEAYFEMLNVPFSTCSSYISTLAFDKHLSKMFLSQCNKQIAKLAPSVFVRRGDNISEAVLNISTQLSFPVFVKPTQGGSSFGVTRVTSAEELSQAINYAFTESCTVIVEQGILGRELTCAAYWDGNMVQTLPPVEIVTKNAYFDYDAKYNGNSEEICPAPISESQTAELQRVTAEIYSVFGCKGVVRMDYILGADGLYFLEINTIPGMTSASIVPKMIKTAGMDMTAFLSTIIECS